MNNQGIPENVQGNISFSQLIEKYDKRVEKGDIFWAKENGLAVMNIRRFDIAGEEIGEPLKMSFSENQLRKIRIDYETRANQFKLQAYELLDQAAALETEFSSLYEQIEKDVQKAQKGK